jgi:hypothetical protein
MTREIDLVQQCPGLRLGLGEEDSPGLRAYRCRELLGMRSVLCLGSGVTID